jgi:hypothetical protein
MAYTAKLTANKMASEVETRRTRYPNITHLLCKKSENFKKDSGGDHSPPESSTYLLIYLAIWISPNDGAPGGSQKKTPVSLEPHITWVFEKTPGMIHL